jgi:competence protein ComEA
MSPRERNALLLVLGLGVAGHILRAGGIDPGAHSLPSGFLDSFPAGDPLAHRDLAIELARPLAAGERVDVDRADARELQRLPGVGPALAGRIVADRESLGVFGGIAGLDRVAGIGPATLARLAPHLRFSGAATDPPGRSAGGVELLNHADPVRLERLPGIGPARARAIVAFRDSAGPFRHVKDLRLVQGIPGTVVDRVIDALRLP